MYRAIKRAQTLPPETHLTTIRPEVSHDFACAYRLLLALQSRLKPPTTEKDLDHMSLMVVGFLMMDLWTSQGELGLTPVHAVIHEVASAQDDSAMLELGRRYERLLLRPFRDINGPPPNSLSHPTRSSFDTMHDMLNDRLVSSPTSYSGAKKLALARDNFRCIVTGKIDVESMIKSDTLMQMAQECGSDYTKCCHIISQSTTQDLEDYRDKSAQIRRNYASAVSETLRLFGFTELFEAINNSSTHILSNILTMGSTFQGFFDNLQMWFEPTGAPHRYQVNPAITENPPSLPDPRLLALHATCCRAAHMSGAAEHFDDVERDLEDSLVLAEDGSSAITLISVLRNIDSFGLSTA